MHLQVSLSVTGLFSRAFCVQLHSASHRALRCCVPSDMMSLIDVALSKLSIPLATSCRSVDLLSRINGETFCTPRAGIHDQHFRVLSVRVSLVHAVGLKPPPQIVCLICESYVSTSEPSMLPIEK